MKTDGLVGLWALAVIVVIATIGVVLWATKAKGETMSACGDRAELMKALRGKYQEELHGFGVTEGKAIIELMVSEAGTWSLVISPTKERSCLIGSGKGWEFMPGTPGAPI